MVSIGTLRYDVIADTAQFQKGMVASRRELTAAKKVFLETRSPAENLSIEIEGLSRLLRKGAIDQKTYNRAVRDLKNQAAIATGGLKGMVAQFKALPASAKLAIKSFVAFRAAGLALNVVRSGLRGITEELESIDTAAKTARKLGLASDELVGLRLAAEEFSGVGASTVDMALQRMTRRISEAAIGTGEAQGALEELNLSAKDLNMAGPAEAFRRIAEAISQVPNQQDRLRLAFKLFDSEGATLVTTLNEGREGLERMDEMAEQLNLTFTELEAEQVEEANNAIKEARAAIKGMTRDLTIELAPALKNMATGFQEGVKWLKEFATAANPVLRLADAINAISGVKTLGDTPGTMDLNFGENKGPKLYTPPIDATAEIVRAQYDAQRMSVNELTEAISDSNAEKMEQVRISQTSREAVELEALATKKATAAEIAHLQALQANRKALEGQIKLQKADEKQKEQQKKAGEALAEAMRTPLEKLVKEFSDIDVLLNVGAIDKRVADMAKERAKEEAIQKLTAGDKTSELAPTAQRGSTEEYDALARINNDAINGDEQRHAALMAIEEATKNSIDAERAEEERRHGELVSAVKDSKPEPPPTFESEFADLIDKPPEEPPSEPDPMQATPQELSRFEALAEATGSIEAALARLAEQEPPEPLKDPFAAANAEHIANQDVQLDKIHQQANTTEKITSTHHKEAMDVRAKQLEAQNTMNERLAELADLFPEPV